jgi:hypothetical protein
LGITKPYDNRKQKGKKIVWCLLGTRSKAQASSQTQLDG